MSGAVIATSTTSPASDSASSTAAKRHVARIDIFYCPVLAPMRCDCQIAVLSIYRRVGCISPMT